MKQSHGVGFGLRWGTHPEYQVVLRAGRHNREVLRE